MSLVVANSFVRILLDGIGEVKISFGGHNETVWLGSTNAQFGKNGKEEGEIFARTNVRLNGPIDGYFIKIRMVVEDVEEVHVECQLEAVVGFVDSSKRAC